MSGDYLKSRGYSTDVRMQLCIIGHTFRIGQLGPDFLILDEPLDYPPCTGEIIMSIDGRLRRWPVKLPHGMSASNPRISIAN